MSDEPIGEIRDFFGNVLSTIKAPVDAMITVAGISPSVGMGNVLVERHKVL